MCFRVREAGEMLARLNPMNYTWVPRDTRSPHPGETIVMRRAAAADEAYRRYPPRGHRVAAEL